MVLKQSREINTFIQNVKHTCIYMYNKNIPYECKHTSFIGNMKGFTIHTNNKNNADTLMITKP